VQSVSREATRYLKQYFGARPSTRILPGPLLRWLREGPRSPFCRERDGRRLVVSLIDYTRKRGKCFLLEERATNCPGLSARETSVLHWLGQGKSNEQIGLILGIKTATVKKHLEHIFTKLGVENRTAAAYYADQSAL
jgi:DNA-binding CsgD family transcriptional regulator